MVRNCLLFMLTLGAFGLFSLPGLPLSGNLNHPAEITREGALSTLLDEAAPYSEAALLMAEDGTAIRIHRTAFARVRLLYTDSGWCSVSDSLPPDTNLRGITGIAVDRTTRKYALHCLDGLEETATITPYTAILRGYEPVGESERNGDRVIQYQAAQPFVIRGDSLLVLRWEQPESTLGQHTVTLNRYYFTADRDTVEGLWRHPPAESIYSLHAKLAGYMQEGPLLILFVDSYGVRLHEDPRCSGNELAPLPLQPLRAGFPSMTESSYWAFGTGRSYWLRGEDRTLFSDILHSPDEGLMLEDDHPIYTAPVPVIPHTDANGDGFLDDDIYRSALAAMSSHPRFLLVHFHSIDDAGHHYGPYSEERFARVRVVSGYVRELVQRWPGPVLLFSDHGMHDNGRNGGTHSTAAAEDMLALWAKLK